MSSDDELLQSVGIPIGSGQGIDACCASHSWTAVKSSFTDSAYPRDLLCVTIFSQQDDDTPQAAASMQELSRACVLAEDDTKAAGDRAITEAARTALAHALRTLA